MVWSACSSTQKSGTLVTKMPFCVAVSMSILSVPVHPTPRPPTPFPTRYRVGSQSPPATDLRVKWCLQCLLRKICVLSLSSCAFDLLLTVEMTRTMNKRRFSFELRRGCRSCVSTGFGEDSRIPEPSFYRISVFVRIEDSRIPNWGFEDSELRIRGFQLEDSGNLQKFSFQQKLRIQDSTLRIRGFRRGFGANCIILFKIQNYDIFNLTCRTVICLYSRPLLIGR